MTRICRTSIAILLAALIALPGTAFAADSDSAAAQPAPPPRLTYNGQPIADMPLAGAPLPAIADTQVSLAPAVAFAQRGYRRGRGRNNGAAMAAMLLGAAGAIAGSAVLVYANRPECSANPNLSGCGYGTKVVGGAVLSAGLVGVLVGALTWR